MASEPDGTDMKARWDWRPALYVLLGLVVGAILTTVVFVAHNDKGDATMADTSRVADCVVSNDTAAVLIEPLGHEFGLYFRASRGAFKYEFAGQSYTVAFTKTASEAETLSNDVKGSAELLKISPNYVRTKGSVAYWPNENSDDYLDAIAACLK